jgi:predicted dehydrogenase
VKYGFNHRYHGSVRHAQDLITSGQLGEIVNIRGVYGKSKIVSFASGWRAERNYAGGGILLDQGIHMVDLMRLFCGEFEHVQSYVSNSYWHHDVEDNVYALLRDRKGRVAMLHSSATQWQHKFSLDIALTEGFIELKGILSGSKSYGEEQLVIGHRNESDTGTAREEIITYLEDPSWANEVDEFADAITKKSAIVCGTAEDALRTMELVYRIYWADPVWREAYGITDPGTS